MFKYSLAALAVTVAEALLLKSQTQNGELTGCDCIVPIGVVNDTDNG